MESEIRVIQLERETLKENNNDSQNDVCSSLVEIMDSEEVKVYFATDYFDSLIVTKKSLKTPLADIMSMKGERLVSGREISVQSYALYFSQNMWEKYEEKQAIDTKDKMRRTNPFEQGADPLCYLSIIQVHITPEILRRTTYDKTDLWDENHVILEPFIDDLYTVIDDCVQECAEDAFVYRVYQMLSTGDLAVVIKSKFPATSYKISSRIRQRVARGGKSDSGTEYWTLYKTYTLLAIERGADLRKDADKDMLGKFVIRGCYSCKYWSEVKPEWRKEHANVSKNPVFGLNGRYDFSMDLTVKEFADLYKIILKYKGRQIEAADAISSENIEKSANVGYLKDLLENGYLSYINERYLLMRSEDTIKDDECISKDVHLNSASCMTLREANDNYINNLLERFAQVKSAAIRIHDAHKNLEHYFDFMERQILSCRTINQVSDTRVYVPKIGKQLEIALDAIDVYREIIIQKKSATMLNSMVKYIMDMVHMLDSYTEYIRNNNLQSLQTPNYNIESSMSMEKILIGYNEYFRSFITAYLETYQREHRLEEMDNEKQYLPIVIPDLHYMDISVKVLFPEGFSTDWKLEKEIRKEVYREKGERHYLMVVESPTLTELGDMPVFMALLFHEMAHQFRYIGRKERNEILLSLLVDRYAFLMANNMAEKICWDICTTEVWTEVRHMLKNGLKDSIQGEIRDYFNQEDNVEKWNAPLIYFRDEVIGLLSDLSKSWNYQMNIEGYTRYFIKSLQKTENLCNEKQFKYLAKMRALLKREGQNTSIQTAEEWQGVRERLVMYAFVIAGIAACDAVGGDIPKGMEWIFDENEVESRIPKPKENGEEEEEEEDKNVYYEKLWEESIGCLKINADIRSKIGWIKTALDNLWRYYVAPTEKGCENYFRFTKKILKEAYRKSCKEWKKTEKNYAAVILEEDKMYKGKTAEVYRSWSLVGRYLGIDYEMEENCEKFTRILRDNSFVEVDKGDLKRRVDVYREVTADMFMYTVMKMTPFTYLNLIVSVIPTTNLQGTNLERIISVLYIMASTNNKADEKMCDYYTAMESMWDEFIGYCRKMLCESDDNAGEEFQELMNALEEYGKNEYIGKRANADFEKLKDIIENNAKNNKEKDEEKMCILIHIRKICVLLQDVVRQEENFITLLEETEAVRDNYMFGKERWKRMRKKLLKNSEWPEGSDKLIQELLRLGEESAEHLKKAHYKVGIIKNEKLNEDGIKFLLRSYYSQKIKDSRMERKNENSY